MNNSVERENLLSFFNFALESVQGRQAVRSYLTAHNIKNEKIAVLAIGKAAFSMLEGASDILGKNILQSLLITKDGHLGDVKIIPNLEYRLSAHPVPDERSLQAGEKLLEWLEALPAKLPLLVLISGGASSLVEKLPDELRMSDIQKLNQWLLSSGLPIDEMNRIRRSISLIKGGRLRGVVGERPVTQLLISDVPGDDPAIIGSGLLISDNRKNPNQTTVPEWITKMQLIAEQAIPQHYSANQNIECTIVASNKTACETVKHQAMSNGYFSEIVGYLDGDVTTCANSIFSYLMTAQPGCYIWGGETTVQLPENPGRGGRNQQLALLLAQQLQNTPNMTILCAGTDGTDGPTEDAGALVDGGTIARGEQEGFELSDVLANADAGSFLAASGDLINTGPTGTNVMDLVIALKK